ncbi:MAG: shikimate kinase [Tepidibacter sp.]|jgi:shikimate kinase|uniref:shikimate kinase n=1 Tax=Tepidibacter sp. TaxID=2529387 RepID=UPI0025D10AC2|nr:shikimate kinase [Tepidibacter sp.]MCT4507370.1 shikimate kinase [Tepidibacter sp.]
MKKINKNIVLIGMPGCGKTSIGNILAEKLGMEFIDIDKYIEEKEERSITEIFNYGEDYFRKIESKAVKEVSGKLSTVISTGGGVVKSYSNIEMLNKNGIIIFINRPIEDIIADVDISSRPLLKEGKEKIYNLFKQRYSLYKKYCNCEIINDIELNEVVNRIIKCL